jgi:hypothetical protein
MASVPALAFGLGMYLPIGITMSIFSGGVAGYFISKSGKTEKIRKIRKEQGTLIASGLMAGAAIIGTIGAILLLPTFGAPMEFIDLGKETAWYESTGSQILSVVMFLLLMLICYGLACKGARMEMEETGETE